MSTKLIVGAIAIAAIGVIVVYIKSKRNKSTNKPDATKTTDKPDATKATDTPDTTSN
ncbi:MAG TPA: hypothetical protein VGR54_02385 [Nitrosopumilaceae archaeon]|nr:hypothetical protein [Nitrosopumilaceae archaeon]